MPMTSVSKTRIYFEPVGKMRKASLAQRKQFYRSAEFTIPVAWRNTLCYWHCRDLSPPNSPSSRCQESGNTYEEITLC